uniref:Geranylgeranyl transferase type-2 subunit alpha n=1 Tax=Anopheles maculatus TaxID=74869 RepID=A0A182SEB5_9DIPT
MHGRLKVRTSAEEAARKKLEQQQKVKMFRAAMGRIFEKKSAEEYDSEMMDLTAKLLGSNPDIATLWNLRRICILALKDSNTEDIQSVFDKDLGFTEMCLMVNPKSYCAWHHRCWILENAPTADWQKEVELCTNKLLPLLYPNVDDPSRPISEEKLKEELELVLTAAFTDPNDSSAWFYQRWLLGYSQPELDLATCRIDTNQSLAILSFSVPINLITGGFKLNVPCCDECSDTSKWMPATEGNTFDTTWIMKGSFIINEENGSTVTLTAPGEVKHVLNLHTVSREVAIGVKKPKFGYEFGSAIVDVLKAQLASCQELLEYEPDSKWTLLTAALLMKAIDRRGYYGTIRQHLAKLETVDALRQGYYLDLASKWIQFFARSARTY